MSAIVRGGSTAGEASRSSRPAAGAALAAVALAALVLWLWVTVPLAAGQRTLFFRDVFANHLALKAFGAEELAAGRIPAFNPTRGLGQPFRGNPSALAFYPGNLLYLALPFWSAFNLHFALHWLLAALTFYLLARELGQSRAAALLAALAWAGGGWVLSCLSFYNLIAVAAWWPLAMVGAVRGGRGGRGGYGGTALGGLACGLALLAGEPVTVALGMVPLALAALAGARLGEVGRSRDDASARGPRSSRELWRGLATVAGIALLGAAVALPQLVATARVSGFTYRGGHGVIASQAVAYTLHPLRYLELLIPFPFGRPLDVGVSGFWADGIAPQLPFFLTLYVGIVALGLALGAVRRRPAWTGLALAGLLGSWWAGLFPDLLMAVTAGLFRFPEKLLVWSALAVPLLAGWGLDRALERQRKGSWRWGWLVAGGVALGLAAALAALRGSFVDYARGLDAPALAVDRAGLVDTQLGLWTVALALAGALALATGWALARRSAALVVALQLFAVCQLWPLLRTAETAPFGRPTPWAARVLASGAPAAFTSYLALPSWHESPRYRIEGRSKAAIELIQAQDLSPAPGALHGLEYPLYPDIEGMSSPLYAFLLINLPRMEWEQRVRWMRVMGVSGAVFTEMPGDSGEAAPGLRLVDTAVRSGVPTGLYAVDRPVPEAWWPRRVETAEGALAALVRVAEIDDPLALAVVSDPVEHRPGGSVRVTGRAPDAIELAVSGPGGVVAVRRSYQTLWRATAGDRELPVMALDLTLLGVEVPPGEHTVRLSVSAWPEKLAATGGLAALGVAAALGLLSLRRRRAAPGAAEAGR